MLRIKIQGFSNIMSLCVLDAEIAHLDITGDSKEVYNHKLTQASEIKESRA